MTMRNAKILALAGLLTALAMATVVADETNTKTDAGEAKASVPDSKIGLAHGTVFEVLSPDPVVPDSSEPGDRHAAPAWNKVAPPMIPHGIEDFLPITRDSSACVDCHMIDEQAEGDPTPIPASHRIAAKEGESAALDGRRWICNSCHVPLTDAKPLPASTRPAKTGMD
jgi:cytochrome c-type protein NapB